MSLEDDEGNVIKEKEYGRAYLSDVNLDEAAEDWWETVYHNRINKRDKRKYSNEAREVYKIVDVLSRAWRTTLFEKFLCDAKEILDRVRSKKEAE
jgi:hypothetical protein